MAASHHHDASLSMLAEPHLSAEYYRDASHDLVQPEAAAAANALALASAGDRAPISQPAAASTLHERSGPSQGRPRLMWEPAREADLP